MCIVTDTCAGACSKQAESCEMIWRELERTLKRRDEVASYAKVVALHGGGGVTVWSDHRHGVHLASRERKHVVEILEQHRLPRQLKRVHERARVCMRVCM